MAALEGSLAALSTEWLNKSHGSMRGLLERLLKLKVEKTYERAMYDLCTYSVLPRDARNPEYVAHLLYMVDERRFPIVALQPILHLDQGHLYRTLERAHVEFVATKSAELRVDEELYPWPCQVHVDPGRELVAIDGREYAFGDPASPVLVWLDEEEKTYRLSYRENQRVVRTPPPRLRRRA